MNSVGASLAARLSAVDTLENDFIIPDWPAPARVRAAVTTRRGGVSLSPWDSFNLADHVEDSPEAVLANRALLREVLALPAEPLWLQQVHGCDVAMPDDPGQGCVADARISDRSGEVCAVLTADCLPVLFCDRAGTRVAAAHAGWRGLADGVLEQTVQRLQVPPGQLLAWLGPAIGPAAFEVGDEVRQVFVDHDPAAAGAFTAHGPGHWLADIYQLARQRLAAAGVTTVSGGGFCTVADTERFYSYRRNGKTGRMASLIWIEPEEQR